MKKEILLMKMNKMKLKIILKMNIYNKSNPF